MGLLKFLVIGGAVAYFINRSKDCHKNTRVYRVYQQSNNQDEAYDELPPYHHHARSPLRQRLQEEAEKARISRGMQQSNSIDEQQPQQQYPESPLTRTNSNQRLYIEQVHPEPTATENQNYNYPTTPQEPAQRYPQRGWMIMEPNPEFATIGGNMPRRSEYEQPKQGGYSWFWSW